jgi:hypothetical protein
MLRWLERLGRKPLDRDSGSSGKFVRIDEPPVVDGNPSGA